MNSRCFLIISFCYVLSCDLFLFLKTDLRRYNPFDHFVYLSYFLSFYPGLPRYALIRKVTRLILDTDGLQRINQLRFHVLDEVKSCFESYKERAKRCPHPSPLMIPKYRLTDRPPPKYQNSSVVLG